MTPAPDDELSGGPAAEQIRAAGLQVPHQRNARPSAPARTEVLVAVGTDTHRFDRLSDWLEEWYAEAAGQVHVVIQYGHSRPPGIPGAVPFLRHTELQDAMSRAALVVCHGGPATILEARRHGHLPIVVPRDPRHGEHIDNHQQLFARRLGAAGMIALCESRDALIGALHSGIREPAAFIIAANDKLREARLAAAARVGEIVENLIESAARRPGRSWRPW